MIKKIRNSDSDKALINWGIIIAILIVLLWIITFFLLKDIGLNERGTLGDMFGSINALFSGLALAGIIFTVLLQRKELQLQREELRLTRKEFKEQNKTLKIQRFENTFFNLLNLHNQIINDISLSWKEREYVGGRSSAIYRGQESRSVNVKIVGRKTFEVTFSSLSDSLVHVKSKDVINTVTNFFVEESEMKFNHYFRNLLSIFRHINFTFDEDDPNMQNPENNRSLLIERNQYSSIVKLQMSDYELLLLFYYCISDLPDKELKKCVEKLSILSEMPQAFIEQSHAEFIDKSAFEA